MKFSSDEDKNSWYALKQERIALHKRKSELHYELTEILNRANPDVIERVARLVDQEEREDWGDWGDCIHDWRILPVTGSSPGTKSAVCNKCNRWVSI